MFETTRELLRRHLAISKEPGVPAKVEAALIELGNAEGNLAAYQYMCQLVTPRRGAQTVEEAEQEGASDAP
jgi:hypothetical protein